MDLSTGKRTGARRATASFTREAGQTQPCQTSPVTRIQGRHPRPRNAQGVRSVRHCSRTVSARQSRCFKPHKNGDLFQAPSAARQRVPVRMTGEGAKFACSGLVSTSARGDSPWTANVPAGILPRPRSSAWPPPPAGGHATRTTVLKFVGAVPAEPSTMSTVSTIRCRRDACATRNENAGPALGAPGPPRGRSKRKRPARGPTQGWAVLKGNSRRPADGRRRPSVRTVSRNTGPVQNHTACARTFRNVSSPFLASATTWSPSLTRPCRISSARGSRTMRWMMRFSGRAP